MAGSNVADVGVVVSCPSCGQEVMQKGMIPVLQDGNRRYLCKECARALIPGDEQTSPPDPEPAVPTPGAAQDQATPPATAAESAT